jgi:hypothetical protein
MSNHSAELFILHGRKVSEAIAECNARNDSPYVISGNGEALIDLGDALLELDSFVGDIATRLKAADTGTITLEIAQAVVGSHLVIATVLEREAGEITLATIQANFGLLDSIKGGKSDGAISINDLKKAANDPTNPQLAAAAQWLLDHPEVRKAIDVANADPGAATDNRISRADVERYLSQRVAYQIVMDNFAVFDGANGKKPNGKLDRAEVEKLAKTSKDPAVRAAAQMVLDDPRVFAGHVTGGDGTAGPYDLDDVAKQYGEPKLPLPTKGNPLRTAVCGTAGVFSYVGWLDLANDVANLGSTKGSTLAAHSATTVGTGATGILAKQVIKRELVTGTTKIVASGATRVLGTPVAIVATGVDLVCRATGGHDWGTLNPTYVQPNYPDPTKRNPDGTYPSGSTESPYMDGAGVPVPR